MESRDGFQARVAEALARHWHAGQVDKAGKPYVSHPEAVAAHFPDHPRRRALSWGHDLREDTPVTLEELRAAGMAEDIIAGIEALTHHPGEPREDYYARILLAGEDVLAVKAADIEENERPERLALLDTATQARLREKYGKARRCLGLPPRQDSA